MRQAYITDDVDEQKVRAAAERRPDLTFIHHHSYADECSPDCGCYLVSAPKDDGDHGRP